MDPSLEISKKSLQTSASVRRFVFHASGPLSCTLNKAAHLDTDRLPDAGGGDRREIPESTSRSRHLPAAT